MTNRYKLPEFFQTGQGGRQCPPNSRGDRSQGQGVETREPKAIVVENCCAAGKVEINEKRSQLSGLNRRKK